MLSIVAIDPGLNCTGIAWLGDDGRICVASIRPKGKAKSLGQRVSDIMSVIVNGPKTEGLSLNPTVLIIEKPQVYAGRLQKGDPNDLIDLAVLVGYLLGNLLPSCTLLPLPREWKGQVPKEIHHRRILKKHPYLKKASKDALDAAGLLLWGAERMKCPIPDAT
jgi:hypothetical protein